MATVGKELAISTLTRMAREIMIGFAFQEVLNYILSNKEILCTKMKREAGQSSRDLKSHVNGISHVA